MSRVKDFAELAVSMSPQEIVEGLSNLSSSAKKVIISELKQTLDRIRYRRGQLCKVLLRDAGEKFGVIIGGGQKAKMWILGTPSITYYTVAWEAILEQYSDLLYVKKQGKYRWPVDQHDNEEHYKSNQKLITKYLNDTE